MQHCTTAFPMFLHRKPRDRAYRYEAAKFLYYYAMYTDIRRSNRWGRKCCRVSNSHFMYHGSRNLHQIRVSIGSFPHPWYVCSWCATCVGINVYWNCAVDVTGSQLHDIVWGSIRRLHEIGLNVICVVADGAKPNSRFMKDHSHKEGTKNGIVYKARNIYNPSMFVYLMSDVLRLIKTTRNCWLCSQFVGVRCLWVCKPTMYAHTHTSISM